MKFLDKSVEMAEAMFPAEYDNRDGYQSFHFCFIWKRNKLLSVGVNDVNRENGRVLTFAQKFNVPVLWPYMHAEINAISKLWGRHIIDQSLKTVVIRINKHFHLKNSKPCENCMPIMEKLGMTNKLWYSTNHGIVRFSA